MNFFLSLAFNILSCALEENIKFLLTKFPEVAKLDKLLSSIWCLVHSYISMAWILVEQYAYNIASVCITTSRKKKKKTPVGFTERNRVFSAERCLGITVIAT